MPSGVDETPQISENVLCACVCEQVVKLVGTPGTVVSGSQDGILRVWDIEMRACLWYCGGHSGPIHALDSSTYPNLGSIASGQDFVARIWRIDRFDPCVGDRALHKLEGHEGSVLCLGFTPDGVIMSTGGVDGTVRIWRSDDATCLTIFRHGPQAVTCLDTTHRLLVTGSKDASIQVWDLQSLRHHGTFGGHHMAITKVDIVDGKLCSSSEDGYTMVWSMAGRGQFRFSMDNTGILSAKPDAPKNVPEKVVLQAVHGEHIITKTLFGYPTVRTFNTRGVRQCGRSRGGPIPKHHPLSVGPNCASTATPALHGSAAATAGGVAGASAPHSIMCPQKSHVYSLSFPRTVRDEEAPLQIDAENGSPAHIGSSSMSTHLRTAQQTKRSVARVWYSVCVCVCACVGVCVRTLDLFNHLKHFRRI